MSTESHAPSHLLTYHVSLLICYEVLGFVDVFIFHFVTSTCLYCVGQP